MHGVTVSPLAVDVAFVAFLAVVATGGWFQSAAHPNQVPAPTIRVSTHLVLVDVVVTDKQGKPIDRDFVPKTSRLRRTAKPRRFRLSCPREKISLAAEPLPPGIYSNKPQYRSPGGPITVMLLDAVNTPFSDQAYARRQMLSFIQSSISPVKEWRFLRSPARLMCCRTSPATLRSCMRHYNDTTSVAGVCQLPHGP